jgi:hypothetical protein
MMTPSPGLMACHNGTPFEFLYLVRGENGVETWRVRPLFVDKPYAEVVFRAGDRLTPLHSKTR